MMIMDLRNKLDLSLKDAMRAGDDARKRTIRLILASVKLSEVEKGKPLDDEAVIAVIQKEIKIRKEALDGAQQAGRSDLLDLTKKELSILEEFLPKQLSDMELIEIIRTAIAESGAINAADTGKVMKLVMPKVKGQATGDRISLIVRDLLTPSG
jgi:uncharacterized protein